MAKHRRKKSWAVAAERVLAASDRPLTSLEIVEIAVRRGLMDAGGKTPHNTVQATIWRHRRDHGDESLFVLVGEPGTKKRYWLRDKAAGKKG